MSDSPLEIKRMQQLSLLGKRVGFDRFFFFWGGFVEIIMIVPSTSNNHVLLFFHFFETRMEVRGKTMSHFPEIQCAAFRWLGLFSFAFLLGE